MAEVFPTRIGGEVQFLTRKELNERRPDIERKRIFRRMARFVGGYVVSIQDAFDAMQDDAGKHAGPIASVEYARLEVELQRLASEITD
jgi:hypothetical protein